jgi:hypothetical protein
VDGGIVCLDALTIDIILAKSDSTSDNDVLGVFANFPCEFTVQVRDAMPRNHKDSKDTQKEPSNSFVLFCVLCGE